MTIFQSQAFLVEGVGGKVIESVKSSNPCTDLSRLLISTFQSTIGAGDTFIAGILYSLFYNSQNWDLENALKFANELAGRKVTQEGFSGLTKGLEPWF
jgi:fructose-1-phosphate kinase PfkB-like protein